MQESKNISRVVGKKVSINDKVVKQYFNHRAGENLSHRYNYALNQDDHPDLAIERDRYEKEKMGKFLKLSSSARVLDVGCGVGRWADEIIQYYDYAADNTGEYVGVDYSDQLLEIARQSVKCDRASFLEGSFQDLPSVLCRAKVGGTFDRVLINGVLQYINDKDIDLCFENINKVIDRNCIIYIKEAVGRDDRFSLVDYYSDELKTNYNTIFRTVEEYSGKFLEFFLSKGFYMVSCGPTWDNDLENRKESMSYYWIMERLLKRRVNL